MLGTLVFAGAAALSANYGDWQVTDASDGSSLVAITINDSGSGFGMACTAPDSCMWLLVMNSSCKPGDSYTLLVNSAKSADTLDIYCDKQLGDAGWRYFFKDFDKSSKAFGDSGRIGFAVAENDGQFRVVRFSLNGATQALVRLDEESKARLKQSTRDLSL